MPHPLAADTSLVAEARQIAFFRTRSPAERLHLMFDLIAFALASSRTAIQRAYPTLDALAQARLLVELRSDPQRASQISSVPTIEGPTMIPQAIHPVVMICDQLQIAYYIAGSIASSAYSLPRTTYAVDIVADMQPYHVAPFIHALETAYYVDRESILEALLHRSSFNLTHHATGINIDIFIPEGRPYDQQRFQRAQRQQLPGLDQPVALASPEDIVLSKLAWYELGNRVSDQQWRDVQGLLRVQANALDVAYMQRWAIDLGSSNVLAFALRGERPPHSGDTPQQDRLF